MIINKDNYLGRFDSIIIGAGPTGCASALLLAKKNKKILLLEATDKCNRKFAGEWLHPAGVKVLRKVGLDHLIDDPKKVKGKGFAIFPSDGSVPVELSYPNDQYSLSFHHHKLVDELRKEVSRYKENITFLSNAKVKDIYKRHVYFDYCSPEAEEEIEYEAKAIRIIGAEGRTSMVRKKFKKLPKAEVVSIMGGILLQNVKLPFQGKGHVFLGGPGPMLAYQIGPNEVRICIDVPLEYKSNIKDKNWIVNNYKNYLPSSISLVFEEEVLRSEIFWIGNSFLTRNFYGNSRYVFLGDAAGTTHPLTGIGITMGFLDADVFSESYNFKEFTQKRVSQSLVPEVLAKALYDCFSRKDNISLELQKSTFDLWRKSPKERERTMNLLMCETKSVLDFVSPFARIVFKSALITLKKHIKPFAWRRVPTEVTHFLRWVKLPFAHILVRTPKHIKGVAIVNQSRILE